MEHFYPNLWNIHNNLGFFWIVSVLRILSISASSLSIFSPILDRQTILAFIRVGKVSLFLPLVKCMQIGLHLLISTSTVILKRLTILFILDIFVSYFVSFFFLFSFLFPFYFLFCSFCFLFTLFFWLFSFFYFLPN